VLINKLGHVANYLEVSASVAVQHSRSLGSSLSAVSCDEMIELVHHKESHDSSSVKIDVTVYRPTTVNAELSTADGLIY